MENLQQKNEFLDRNIFVGLKNMNDGFDAASIKYFTATEFRIVLERIETFGLGVYGIEPWKNGNMFDVYSFEDYSKQPTDPDWYYSALNDFISTGEELLYAATYYVPQYERELK